MKPRFKTAKRAGALFLAALMGLAGGITTASADSSIDPKYNYYTTDLGTDDVTLNIAMDQGSSLGLDMLAEAFHEEYPNVTVNVYYMGWADLASKVGDLESSDPIDGFMISYRQKMWLDMYMNVWKEYCEDFREADIVDLSMFNDDLMSFLNVDGKIFALPLINSASGLITNMDLLNKCGITKAPETLDELLEACAAVKANGYTPFRCQRLNMMYVLEGMTTYELEVEGKQDEFVDALINSDDGAISGYMDSSAELFYQMMTNGYFDYESEVYNPEANNGEGAYMPIESYKEDCYAFMNGDVAFYPCDSSIISSLHKREVRLQAYVDNPFTYTFEPIPTKYGMSPEHTSSYSLCVCKDGANVDWMNKFVQFVFYRENKDVIGNVAIFSDNQFCMSPFDTDTLYTDISQQYFADYHRIIAGDASCPGDYVPVLAQNGNGYGVFRGALFKKMNDILAAASESKQSALDAMDMATRSWFVEGNIIDG